MAETKKTSKTKPIADVAHPNESAPSDTSKAIITHRPMMKDPMVVEDKSETKDEDNKKPLSKDSGELKVIPITEPEADTEPEKESPKEEESAEAPKTEESAPEPTTEDDPKAVAEKNPDTKDAAGTDKSPKESNIEAEAAAEAERDAKLQKVIDSKRYFLPINAVEQRRSARFVGLGVVLALVLAVAWVDVALDAGLIQLKSVKPVTHIFSN